MKKSGFTLIELSIVLIIIGLIIGGILAGQELSKQARYRSIINELNGYLTAINVFKLKYNSYPGDMPNATQYWSGSGNGNGDSQISYSETVSGNGPEWFRAWDHMNLANLLNYNIIYTGAYSNNSQPKSSATSTFWQVGYDGPFYLKGATNWLSNAFWLSSADTYSMDLKIDDGKASTGKYIALGDYAATSGYCTTTGYNVLSNANYVIPDPNNYQSCRLFYVLQ